jgi:hypothetical protein
MGKTPEVLNLRAGELVRVRTAEEIVATLDENGKMDGMPFMPEMLDFCGKQFRVGKRAHKTCDTIVTGGPLRRVDNSVHLEGLRCTGAAHGGCEAECLLFWKEAWLERIPAHASITTYQTAGNADLDGVWKGTHLPESTPSLELFSCQATQLRNFTKPMSPWNIKQYVTDVMSGNVGVLPLLRSLGIALFNGIQRRRRGTPYPNIVGRLEKRTPEGNLNLQPGELVQIKSKEEIEATLDRKEKTRGLFFDREMLLFCGGTYRVRRRVKQILEERSGRMLHFNSDCIVLEGTACRAHFHAYCPRAIYGWWREAWLRRVEVNAPATRQPACAGEEQCVAASSPER